MTTGRLDDGRAETPVIPSRQALLTACGSVPVREAANVILQEHIRRGRRGLAMCGASSGAGVTFVSTVVAMALAQVGARVLLIEANVRRPSLDVLLPPPTPDDAGLLGFLQGSVEDPASVIHPDVVPNVSLVYAGGKSADAADLFDTERFQHLVAYALRSYDLTLIDTPPANRCAETRRIAALAGYAAIVARRNETMAEDLGTLMKDLRLDRTEVIGSIFNEG